MCTALKGPNLTWMLILFYFFFDMDAYSFVGFIITCIKFGRVYLGEFIPKEGRDKIENGAKACIGFTKVHVILGHS